MFTWAVYRRVYVWCKSKETPDCDGLETVVEGSCCTVESHVTEIDTCGTLFG